MTESKHFSTCPMDCPSACALEVTQTDGRVTGLRGNRDHPFTRGVICGKVARYVEIQNGPRLTSPLLRVGAKGADHFRPVTWEVALERIVTELQRVIQRSGPQAVFAHFYAGTMGLVQRSAVERLVHRAGFSRMAPTICASIAGAGWLAGVGRKIGPDPAEMRHSDLILLWGINAVSTHINLMTFVREARQQGARLVVVDPYRTRTARLADQHLDPRPGTDGALVAAMIHVLLEEGLSDPEFLAERTDFDPEVREHFRQRSPEWAAPITGLDPAVIRAFARDYGRARAPFLKIGFGLSRQANGAVNLHAVSCLPAVTGAWRRVGGGALLSTSDCVRIDDEAVLQSHWLAQRPSRILDMSRLGALLTGAAVDPPIEALLTFSANPAAACPDLSAVRRGLLREDLFTVVHEQVMTDTARLADVVLPATTFLEHEDLYKSYGQTTLQWAKPVVAPTGAARCNHDVVDAIARGLGFDEPPFRRSVAETVRTVLADSGLPPPESWPNHPWLDVTPSPDAAHFRHGFGQADGRFHFRPGWRDPAMPTLPDHWPVNRRDRADEASRYPLDFMTPPDHAVLNSTFAGLDTVQKRRGPPVLMLNPADAAARGIGDGQPVVVFNDLGRLTLTARLTSDVRPGLCLCESNRVADEFPEGIGLNLLTHADRTAPAGGPAFHDNRVEVAPA
ncbi:MAG: molybdopterin-dependent oxidoreductase [Magnetococcales bacterium]|nr:molybdopterin-dependent oxidoreductase [Magnetococcales bacterium]